MRARKSGGEGTYNHLAGLATRDANTLTFDDLDVVKTRQDLMLDLELGRHGELGALLDFERLVLESLLAAGRRQVDDNGITALRMHRERRDDADARIRGVGEILSTASEAERLLIPHKRFITLICITPALA